MLRFSTVLTVAEALVESAGWMESSATWRDEELLVGGVRHHRDVVVVTFWPRTPEQGARVADLLGLGEPTVGTHDGGQYLVYRWVRIVPALPGHEHLGPVEFHVVATSERQASGVAA